MRLSTSGHCSSGTRYSPGSWPWNNSEESTPGAFASAAESRAAFVVSPPNNCATADGTAARGVHLLQRVLEQVLHVGDAELEECRALNDTPGAGGICLAGEFDDEAAAALDLHHGFLGTELVHARADDALRALDRVGAVGHRTLGLVHLERQVNAAAEVEPQVDRHAPHRRVLHGAGRDVAYAHFRVARHQGHDAQNDERADHVQPLPNLPHRYRFSLSVEGRPRRLAVALELR